MNIAVQAGRNAAANNYLNHVRPTQLGLSEVEQYERAAKECAAGDASACARGTALVNLSNLNVQTTTAQGAGSAGVGSCASEQIDRVANLYVSGEAGVLLASAGSDASLTAAVLHANTVQARAGQDLTARAARAASVQAEGALSVVAGRDG